MIEFTVNNTSYTGAWDPMVTRVIDVSRYQSTLDDDGNIIKHMNFEQAASQGIIATAIRCTVGDYYTDPCFADNWKNAGAAGLMRTAYHVITPADSYGRVISAEKQIDRFLSVFGNRQPEFEIVRRI